MKKVWIYQAQDFLPPSLTANILKDGAEFLANWKYHGKKVDGKIEIIHQLFLIIQADFEISGCGIDQSMHFIQSLENKYQMILTDRMRVAFEKNGEVVHVHVHDLAKLYRDQSIDLDTLFFDSLVNDSLKLEQAWKKPLKNSWHLNFCR